MQSVTKKIVIAVFLAAASYAIIKLFIDGLLELSGISADIGTLMIISLACIASALLSGGPAAIRKTKETGTVKWFNERKGYGFITRDQGEDDIFVHFRNIESKGRPPVFEGQRVSFVVAVGEKGLQAERVTAI